MDTFTHTHIYTHAHAHTHTHTHAYIYIVKVKLATVVDGDQKSPFSIVTTPRCRGGRYSFPWIIPLYH